MHKLVNQLEKKIIGKINAIANGTETTKSAGVNALITRLKALDEVSAEELQKKYIATVKKTSETKK